MAAIAADEPIVKFGKAVEQGNLATVERMLAEGVDPNTRVPGAWLGYTPLFLAVRGNHPAITAALLKGGADPTIEDENGDPVMVAASDHDRVAHARVLIQHGVSIDSKNHYGATALLRVAPYAEAPDIQAKIALGATVDLTDPQGNSALMRAAESANVDAMRVLLAAGAKPGLVNNSGENALLLAIGRDVVEEKDQTTPQAVDLLIKTGADINQRDPEGNSPLLIALNKWRIQPETINLLLQAKPDLSVRDKGGRDALFAAVQNEKQNQHIARLLELGADLHTTDANGTDLLMAAATNNNPGQVSDLIRRGLRPNRTNQVGSTAVHCAILSRRFSSDPFSAKRPDDKGVEILKLLQQHGASLTAADGNGDTPLHLAAMTGLSELVALLLPQFPDPDVRNRAGQTPLHLAADAGGEEIAGLLLARHATADALDAKGLTPLRLASDGQHRETILRLLKSGADLNAAATDGTTALSATLAGNEFDLAKFLIDHGADPKRLADPAAQLLRVARLFHDQPLPAADYAFAISLFAGLTTEIDRKDAAALTALLWVAASNNPAALKAILDRHPDLQARSPDGRTALMWAASTQALESLKTLRAAGADETLRDASGRTAAEWLVWSNVAHPPPVADSPADQTELGERVRRSRQAALQDYLKQNRWDPKDRIAGASPLHLAAALGDNAAISAFLKLGAPPNLPATDHATPLMEAAANGHLKAVQLLLEHGADPALRDDGGDRAIDHAIGLGQIDVVRTLVGQKDPFSGDESDLLVALVNRGDEELLREFLKAGAAVLPRAKRTMDGDPFGARVPDPAAPLAAAAARPDPRLLRVLMEYPAATGADEPVFLTAALHRAASDGRLASVRFLVEERKVDPNTLLDDSFGGVVSVAAGDPADKGPQFVEGYSALSRALEEGHSEVVRYLVEHGATIAGRTREGLPPLGWVVAHQQHEMLRFLLEHRAPTDLVDLGGETALHLAAAANDAAAVRLLLDHGANPNATTPPGRTALEVARQNDATKAAAVLEKPKD
jgi:ankyrin repeat protein